MLDPSADALARHLLTLLPAGQSHDRAALDRLPLPIAHYLGGVLDRRLAREAALPDSEWFEAEAAPVRQAAAAWRKAVREAARFPAESWETTLRSATRQVLAYLTTPVETLADRVFADGPEPLGVEVVRARLAAFSPYPYLREIAEGYLDRKGLEAIGRDDFERLLRRVDQRMVAHFDTADWLTLLEPLFELLDFRPEAAVPTPLLQRFFEAKDRGDIARALAPRDAYDEAMLRALIAETLTTPEENTDSEPQPEQAMPEHEAASQAEDAPLWQRLATSQHGTAVHEALAQQSEPQLPSTVEATEPIENHSTEDETESVSVEVETDLPAGEELTAQEPALDAEPMGGASTAQRIDGEEAPTDHEDQPLWKRFAGPETPDAEALPETAAEAEPADRRRTALSDLEVRLLGSSATERRDWYMQHLTGGSETAYRAVLEALDRATSWTDATQIIAREVFRKHHVNIYSDAAIAFTDAVEARFRA